MLNWKKLKKPIIALAPMADYTDEPFGLMCKKFGAQVIFREMVSADAIAHGNAKTFKMLAINKKERPVIQQIFGNDPKIMAEATKIICKISAPDGIDINMGCPMQKVVKNFHGAALMKDAALAATIVKEVKKAVKIPVSVKTRLGWEKKDEILSFAPIIEKAGADLISIHGRTKKQGYAGEANWKIIAQTKKLLKIPVLANGGIFTREDVNKCLTATNADGVLIARGALGNPWIFSDTTPTLEETIKIILQHAALQVKQYGDYGLILLRKHLVFYFKGIPHNKIIKTKLNQVSILSQLENLLAELLTEQHNIT
ncbi:MAG: tRNA dihydrouridine synthase DusB [Candidatus Magasanikbacteria bacterium]|nr:tRNA dihydrouridine synthase DusB [Candidatus Magasanikbacteria bacterium]